MKTHRCKESLENEVSIRFCDEYVFGDWNITSDKAWRLFKPIYDRDYEEPYLEYICKLNLCPFCGKDLQEINCGNCFNYNIGDGVDDLSLCNNCEFKIQKGGD